MLFTFPSRYWFTIGLSGVFSLTGWAPLIHTGFLVSRATQDSIRVHLASNTGLSPSMTALSKTFFSPNFVPQHGPTTPVMPKQHRFGLFRVRSPLLAESLLFSSPMGTKMFQFPTFASCNRMTGLQPAGLPHSDILGSMVICTYPKLFAAYHVLRRLREPRHPPSALNYFLTSPTVHFVVCG